MHVAITRTTGPKYRDNNIQRRWALNYLLRDVYNNIV